MDGDYTLSDRSAHDWALTEASAAQNTLSDDAVAAFTGSEAVLGLYSLSDEDAP